jgi:hypothetical protein
MNCDHSDEWCLGCVKKLYDENARLTRVNAELLAACKAMVEWIEANQNAKPYSDDFRDAIVKATGANK